MAEKFELLHDRLATRLKDASAALLDSDDIYKMKQAQGAVRELSALMATAEAIKTGTLNEHEGNEPENAADGGV